MKSTGTRRKDLTGQRFGRLVAQQFVGKDEHNNALWSCICDCGGTATVQCVRLKGGHKRSCGCWEKEQQHSPHYTNVRHGRCRTREYCSYYSARERCIRPGATHYENYGGRGIQFLFTSFEQFFVELGPRPANATLDRIRNEGNYEPGNVRWATRMQQSHNTRLAKLKESDVPKIKELRTSGATIASIAHRYRVDEAQISRLLSGESWRLETPSW